LLVAWFITAYFNKSLAMGDPRRILGPVKEGGAGSRGVVAGITQFVRYIPSATAVRQETVGQGGVPRLELQFMSELSPTVREGKEKIQKLKGR